MEASGRGLIHVLFRHVPNEDENARNNSNQDRHFTPEEKAPGPHWIGGWVGPEAGLDDVEKSDPTGTRTLTPRPSTP
jgi:hypothetical protein